jgi:hypothetical protein
MSELCPIGGDLLKHGSGDALSPALVQSPAARCITEARTRSTRGRR